ncbi:MAG: thiamine phosphate synthase [Rubinisphaera brasiliensis]|uniref:thiamine phosphate synthase n=1 Tax=Rubinisphaera brasiliensis TaxID=119 RepID=UPI0039195104
MNRQEQRAAYRILDASANRCREGLRVLEEQVRFRDNDAEMTRQLKTLRHELTAALGQLRLEEHLDCRDTPGDVGTAISTDSERTRSDWAGVRRANMKRVQESLRTLEEYSKLVEPSASAHFEAARYRSYEIEKQLERSENPRSIRLSKSRLYLLVQGDEPDQFFREVAAGGVDVFQIRDKQADDRELLARGRRLRQLTRETDTLLIFNDRVDLALLCEADGVHVGQEELPVAAVRYLAGNDLLVGVSTHSLQQAKTAVVDGADYIGVGPVFPSGTKDFAEFVGPDLVRQVEQEVKLPVFAIGGIDSQNLQQVCEAGGRRIAVTRAINAADQPGRAAADLRKNLENSGTLNSN